VQKQENRKINEKIDKLNTKYGFMMEVGRIAPMDKLMRF